jgi:hypothetical protein
MARQKKETATERPSRASILEKYKDFAGLPVIERRLKHPELPGSLPIRLKDEPTHVQDPHGKKRTWYLRWINGTIDGRTSQITDVYGYAPVMFSDLQNPSAVSGLAPNTDGVVRRGDKGQEWLAKMPLDLYNEIKSRQREAREKRTRNTKLVKEDLANAAGGALGSEAGDTIHDDFNVTVTRHARTTAAEELEAEVS